MASTKGPTIASNKLAMSRALGAAFLNHQVEQLEKTVTNTGPGAANWRDHRRNHDGVHPDKRTRNAPTPKGPKGKDGEATDADGGEDKVRRRDGHKDADVVVVDASVLVHALPQLKKWCREWREEVVIVPLEALNTLDLLKKGTSTLAQRARAASRILEAQVGTNPRIRVQRDDAFVLWDSMFHDQPLNVNATGSPEWVRRTICCARWEVEHASDEVAPGGAKPHVVLAVLSQTSEHQHDVAPTPLASASPVPLPAPQMNRYEPRSSGALVSAWAKKAGIELLDVFSPPGSTPTPANGAAKDPTNVRRSGEHQRRSAEEERGKRGGFAVGGGGRGRRNSYNRNGNERVAQCTAARPPSSSGLVERPPAVMAMMEMVAQPSRVVRVLARGEKLEPDS
ncbi:predicted protein [Sparassis crispa]|uniref:PIN domain-containing protein n=1 Tax=Sparassis crispa TaxID=139825 RepID=A0A401GTX6_9APHY|nr:predicted protein [Sparassis crispa]GBE85667.1 predicted protein [Sparassis crispa]